MAEGSVPPGVLDGPVARGSVHCDQSGEDADKEEDQHHVLREPVTKEFESVRKKILYLCKLLTDPMYCCCTLGGRLPEKK